MVSCNLFIFILPSWQGGHVFGSVSLFVCLSVFSVLGALIKKLQTYCDEMLWDGGRGSPGWLNEQVIRFWHHTSCGLMSDLVTCKHWKEYGHA